MLLHPSVLISTPTLSSREQLSPGLSASGFILAVEGNGDLLVLTTASWLIDVLEIQYVDLDTEQVSWKFRGDVSIQEPQFVVLVQKACDSVSCMLTHYHNCIVREFIACFLRPTVTLRCCLFIIDFFLQLMKTCQMSACITNVCLMKDVLVSLREELHSLSHWRTAIGEKSDSPAALTESLLIPLSCLVLLKLTTSMDARLLHVHHDRTFSSTDLADVHVYMKT